MYLGEGSIRGGGIRGIGGRRERIGGGNRIRMGDGGGEENCGGCSGGGRRGEEGSGLPCVSECQHFC